VGALAAAATTTGCGNSAKPAAVPPVRLSLAAPSDRQTTLAGQIFVTGTVSPASATVVVAGQPVAVHQGSFETRVSIRPGANVIDVLAGAPRAYGAMTAVRVYRQVAVGVPDLSGFNPSKAIAVLTARGLTAHVVDVGGFFQSILPASTHVCRTVPRAGRLVAPGSDVQVQAAKIC
jgi:hypothetical protein